MSEIAGRLAAHAGAYFLQAPLGGPGVLIGGVTGVAPARIVVIGGGVVGTGAARIALGAEGEVTILERSLARLHELDEYFGARARILMSDAIMLEDALREADVVIGAVLVPGALAPRLVTREMLGLMKPRSVIVDVAIDQGGCFETSHPTTHAEPVFEVDGILHYCVANMPGAVPITATRALTNATLPYIRRLAEQGVDAALADDPGFALGLNVKDGEIVYEPVATAYAQGAPLWPPGKQSTSRSPPTSGVDADVRSCSSTDAGVVRRRRGRSLWTICERARHGSTHACFSLAMREPAARRLGRSGSSSRHLGRPSGDASSFAKRYNGAVARRRSTGDGGPPRRAGAARALPRSGVGVL